MNCPNPRYENNEIVFVGFLIHVHVSVAMDTRAVSTYMCMHDYKMFDGLVGDLIVSLHTHMHTHTHTLSALYYSLTRSLLLTHTYTHTLSLFLSLSQGPKSNIPNRDEVIEAYKYVFSQPGAFTPPINYYRAMMRYPEKPPNSDPINVPTLLIWVSTN